MTRRRDAAEPAAETAAFRQAERWRPAGWLAGVPRLRPLPPEARP